MPPDPNPSTGKPRGPFRRLGDRYRQWRLRRRRAKRAPDNRSHRDNITDSASDITQIGIDVASRRGSSSSGGGWLDNIFDIWS